MSRWLCVLVALFSTAGASAQNVLVPVVAHELPGYGGNRWSSELYLSNTSTEDVTVTIAGFLPGRRQPPQPCETFAPVTRTVPARSAVLWSAAELGADVGCATRLVGGLLLHSTGSVGITSRLVNHHEVPASPGEPLHGPGQVVAGIPVAELPPAGEYVLPGLIWHRNPCGGEAFVTSVGFSNPGDEPVTVTLDLAPGLAEAGMRVDGEPVELPYSIEVPPLAWRQIRLTPEPSPLAVCLPPELFDLWVDTSGSLGFYGSVVDEQARDPRTVAPAERAEAGTFDR